MPGGCFLLCLSNVHWSTPPRGHPIVAELPRSCWPASNSVLTTPNALRRELVTAGQVRHRRLLMAAISDAEGGVQALSELDFTGLCRRYGLPEPTRQVRRRDASGRLRYIDVRLSIVTGVPLTSRSTALHTTALTTSLQTLIGTSPSTPLARPRSGFRRTSSEQSQP